MMVVQTLCPKCKSSEVAFEWRDWFGDDPMPPREAYGRFISCLKCGYSWPDEDPEDIIWV